MLTLGDLMDQSDFGLELLTGSPETLELPILGAHNSEMAHPTEFTPKNWILLTLGLRLQRKPEVQRELIRELHSKGITALGFGVNVAFSQPPRSMLDEARKFNFPIFRIPYKTPYREILGFVNRSLISADFSTLQQSFTMQNYLLESLKSGSPILDLGNRLSHLMQGDVYLFDPNGSVRIGSDGEQAQAAWMRIESQRAEGREIEESESLVAFPLSDAEGHDAGWLAVVNAGRTIPTPIVHSVMRSAERFLELIELQNRAAEREERIVREALLKSALAKLTTYEERELVGRFKQFGLGFDQSVRMLIARANDQLGLATAERREVLEDGLRTLEMPYLSMVDGGELVILVQTTTEQIAVWVESTKGGVSIVVGAGREVRSIRDLRKSLRGAETALRHLDGAVRVVDAISLTPWLVALAPKADLEVKIEDVLGELSKRHELLHTLQTYYDHDLNVTSTANVLNIHANTLRYRLGQIEQILGRSLGHIPDLVDIYVALLDRQPRVGETYSDDSD